MCRSVKCDVCGKTTWAGCGQHIDAVKVSVPAGQWCNGKHSQQEIAAARAASPGFLARLFGR
ncbi:hypothetical protein FB556_1223 [Enteractinococcus coprophilus]|uniref:Uncharacterized protein n=1 Tax=Enteractinococcus coprophilus TaxID=1027633 RepID=A0A543AJ29_9MICC|nr:hypothetical protein [Enteractinococcus coprophilus]TQL72563.1 hypothetical protein FB556_1223 [Enteractinococcus coprophilus]